jgi:hypothetical protein
MFKGVSQCVPAMSILYFGQINPHPFPSIPHYSTAFNTYHYALYLLRCNGSEILFKIINFLECILFLWEFC